MPILDPSLQYFLINNDSKQNNEENGYSFFLKYLQIASLNIYRNYETIEASSQFKKDLKASVPLINDKFGCNFTLEEDFENQIIEDYYKYLYDHITRPNKLQESKKSIGTYKISNDKFQTKFYQPHIFFSNYHSWFFSDTPIAILCINSNKFLFLNDENQKQQIFQLIKLEIDLLAGSGFTLVLCYNGNSDTEDLIYQIIKDDQFSELHINIFDDNDFLIQFLNFMKDNFFGKNSFFKGYMYLYSYFFEENSNGWCLMKIFRQIPCTKVISFSIHPKEALKNIFFVQTEPFIHCKTGFNQEYLRVFFCFVPYYCNADKIPKYGKIPENVCQLCQGYISPSCFLNQSKYIEVLFHDAKNQINFVYQVKFHDIHLIRPDLFVNDTLSLTPMDVEMHKSIDTAIEKIKNKFDNTKKLQKSYIHNIGFKDYVLVVRRVAYAYTYFMRNKGNKYFTIRETQIYAVLEACHSFFDKTTKKSTTGVIYQIKTGEGKSCIISIIAAVLAIKNKTVHVVSSNITLSKRDYIETLEFFHLLKLDSAVLLHHNELPRYEKKDDLSADMINSMNEKMKLQYPDKYYANELFKNTSQMNFSVCGVDNNNNISNNKANVIFSTFVNFECFYLHLMENCPGYIDKYFKECCLVMDEVDSILIDEITNGTIISREMNSNAKEILLKVYDLYKDHTEEQTLTELKKYKLTDEIELDDIKQMYKDIQIVNSPEFTDGKKYIIEEISVKNTKRITNLIKRTVKFLSSDPSEILQNAKDALVSAIKSKFQNETASDNDDDDEEEEEDQLDISKEKTFKRIVPFDYDHKGIVEKNKEFSGYIPQFIAIKESKKQSNENLVFKDISISYLYISHPIFAKCYSNICGFTGTIGKKTEKLILSHQYDLVTKKIPRFKPNLRIDFPLLACSSIQNRNDEIINEIYKIHHRGNPILVILENLNEVQSLVSRFYMENKGMHLAKNKNKDKYRTNIEINVFDGNDELVKPDYIAGYRGAVSIGTNICGRGTDIKCSPWLPLHVIVGYYTPNNRVMEQAFGRTARNGQIGTCHCICVKTDLAQKSSLNNDNVSSVINDVDIKASKQKDFIDKYKNNRPWIFDFNVDKQNYKNHDLILKLAKLRENRINVNRIVAYKYKYPLCMSYNTFLKIQAQKVLSIFNCPNCKYSWRIFQKYIREMILQSWSIMINKFDQKNIKKESFSVLFDEEIKLLNKSLEKYLPYCNNKEDYGMIPTFLNICKQVFDDKKDIISNSLGKFSKFYKFFGDSQGPICAQVGFKPYELLSKSGARITKNNVEDTNFIQDPELSYEKKMPNNKISLLSITERIDEIFDKIFQKISSMLSSKIFLKFFLRRTLAGCEFGICLDIDFYDEELAKDPYLLIDKKPLFVATVYIWSMVPVLAGILICVLVYLAGIAKDIFEYISTFPYSFPKDIAKKTILNAISNFLPQASSPIFERIIEILSNIFENEIEKLKKDNDKSAEIFMKLKELFIDDERLDDIYEGLSDKISEFFDNKIKISSGLKDFLSEFVDGQQLLKISVLLILCFTTFIKNFVNNKARIKESKADSKEFDSTYDNKDEKTRKEKSKEKLKKLEEKKEKKSQSKHKKTIPNNQNKQMYNSQLLKLLTTELKHKSISYLEIEPISEKQSNFYIDKSTKKIYRKINISLTNESTYKYIDLFSKNQIRSIVPFYGFVLNGNKSFLLFNSYMKEYSYYSLDSFKKIMGPENYSNIFSNTENQLTFAYGISFAMIILEKNKVDFPVLHPENIIIKYYSNYNYIEPLIFPLESNSELKNPFKMYPELIAPELKENLNDFTYKVNVFAFGKILIEITQMKNDNNESWNKMINLCTDKDPIKRPTFSNICQFMDKKFVKNHGNFEKYMNVLKKIRK